MPKGPNGQKRPGDVIGAAIMVAKIATGEAEDAKPAEHRVTPAKTEAARKAARARTKVTSPKRRSEIAQVAAQKRWAKERSPTD